MGMRRWRRNMYYYTVYYVGGPADGQTDSQRADTKMKYDRAHTWLYRPWLKLGYGAYGLAEYELFDMIKKGHYRYRYVGQKPPPNLGDPDGPTHYCGPDPSWS